MRIHGIQLRGLSAPTGDHQLGLDPGYTVLRHADAQGARRVLSVVRALLHPDSARATSADTRGRAVLTLALRADGCLIAADFARGRISIGRLDAKGAGQGALSGDAHEIEEYLLAVGLPVAEEFERLHVFGVAPGRAGSAPIPPARKAPPSQSVAATAAEQGARDEEARVQSERARLIAQHEAQSRALVAERERLTRELDAAIAEAVAEGERDQARLRELRVLDVEYASLEQAHKATQAALEKNAALTGSVEDFDARLAQFRALAAEHEEERAIVEDKRLDLLADRARLRAAPRRQRVPIALGLALGAAGAAAGAVGYDAGYALAGLGVLALLVALVATRIAHARLARIETLLAVLRVRERTSERRFASEGAQVRGVMQALGVDSLDALKNAAQGAVDLVERAATEKRRLAELAERHGPARLELARLEQTANDVEANPAVRAARAALLACPTAVVLPELPVAAPRVAPAELDAPFEPDTEVAFGDEKPEEEPEPAAPAPGPEILIEATARVLGRSEAEIRARLSPILPVYLRALSTGTFTNARAGENGGWLLRGAAREEQAFDALPLRERELVRFAVQLALLEALAADRRVPLLVGPDLPARGEAEQRALARALKRLASVVQVVQFATRDEPFAELAGKSFEL